MGKWPNTYAFTKAVAENVVEKKHFDIPIGIFRPAIGMSNYFEIKYLLNRNSLL